MRVVVSQSMFFPWVGFLEQLRLADFFIRYDDVQFSKGGFTNRVQIKTAAGVRWLTVPLSGLRLGQSIKEVRIDNGRDWQSKHRELIRQAYRQAPFFDDMLSVIDSVYAKPYQTIADLSYASILALAEYFGLANHLSMIDVSNMGIGGCGSKRVFDVVRAVGGTVYITGHGARNYLDHQMFEDAGISVQYMEYRCLPYPQLHGEFTPFVSALDLIANCGRDGKRFIVSETVGWREFLGEPA